MNKRQLSGKDTQLLFLHLSLSLSPTFSISSGSLRLPSLLQPAALCRSLHLATVIGFALGRRSSPFFSLARERASSAFLSLARSRCLPLPLPPLPPSLPC